MLTRRRNRDTRFAFHTCYFVCLGPGSLIFIFVSIELFVVEISLVNERVPSIHKNLQNTGNGDSGSHNMVPWHRFSGPSWRSPGLLALSTAHFVV